MEKNIEQIDLYELDAKKKELESFRNEKIKGVMIRSRAQWLNDGINHLNTSVLWRNTTTLKNS